jgi:hypothetical protein
VTDVWLTCAAHLYILPHLPLTAWARGRAWVPVVYVRGCLWCAPEPDDVMYTKKEETKLTRRLMEREVRGSIPGPSICASLRVVAFRAV